MIVCANWSSSAVLLQGLECLIAYVQAAESQMPCSAAAQQSSLRHQVCSVCSAKGAQSQTKVDCKA